jgi:hypothetical protein
VKKLLIQRSLGEKLNDIVRAIQMSTGFVGYFAFEMDGSPAKA